MFHPLASMKKTGDRHFYYEFQLKKLECKWACVTFQWRKQPPKDVALCLFSRLFTYIILRFYGVSVTCGLPWGHLNHILRNCLAFAICAFCQGQTIGQRLLTLIIPLDQSCEMFYSLGYVGRITCVRDKERGLVCGFVMNCTQRGTTYCLTFFSFA